MRTLFVDTNFDDLITRTFLCKTVNVTLILLFSDEKALLHYSTVRFENID